MTVSGSTINRRLRDQISAIESDERQAGSEVHQYENQLEQLTAEREDCYSRLAQLYLPELDAQTVKDTLHEVQGKVQNIFNKKQKRRQELDDLLESDGKQKQKFEDDLDDVTSQMNAAARDRDETAKKISQDLAGNESYTGMQKKAAELLDTLTHYKAAAQSFMQDAQVKLKAFERNPVFMYLAQREFGNNHHHGTGLMSGLDAWVAKTIGYTEAKVNYDCLRTMPDLMKAEIRETQSTYDAARKEPEQIERETAERYGLSGIIAKGTQFGKKREDSLAGIRHIDEQHAAYTTERESLDNTKDAYHQDAIKELKGYLKGDSIADLKRLVKTTAAGEDDTLADRIESIDVQVRQFKDNAKDAKARRDDLSRRRAALQTLHQRFRQKDFESDRSYFDSGLNIDALLAGYMLGSISDGDIWRQMDDNQHFTPREDYSTPSYSSHSDDSSSSGGGSGGGGFDSGGGFGGGGGFSSGSGF